LEKLKEKKKQRGGGTGKAGKKKSKAALGVHGEGNPARKKKTGSCRRGAQKLSGGGPVKRSAGGKNPGERAEENRGGGKLKMPFEKLANAKMGLQKKGDQEKLPRGV